MLDENDVTKVLAILQQEAARGLVAGYTPQYVGPGVEVFAAHSNLDIPARAVARISEALESRGYALKRFGVLDVSDGEILLMKITRREE